VGQDSSASTMTCYNLEDLGLATRGGPVCRNKCSDCLWAGGTGFDYTKWDGVAQSVE
jgi:hypothetical protein